MTDRTLPAKPGGIWRRLLCRVGLHSFKHDTEAGASGHSMEECIAFLYCNLYRCRHCPATTWRKAGCEVNCD